MILDMLLLGVQTYPGEVLFVCDEIGVFQRCPQLALGAAMIRSSGAVVILAYQSYSQLQDTYGEKMADTISSNNWATIVLKNTSPASAEHCSKILGMPQEVERIRESKSPWSLLSRRVGRTYSEERPMIYPVTAGEVQSQKDGRGWISAEGKIARIKVKYLEPVIRAPRLIERIVPAPIVEDEPIEATPKPKSKYVQRRLKTA
jgi:type IV secretory pathway TraG/TraD family ATPase VirD4